MNIGNCRFENTLEAPRECEAALHENSGSAGDPFAGLSDRERKAAEALLLLCDEMAEEYGAAR